MNLCFLSSLFFFAGRGATRVDEDDVDPAGLVGVGRYRGVAVFFFKGGGSGVYEYVDSGRPYLYCSAESAAA